MRRFVISSAGLILVLLLLLQMIHAADYNAMPTDIDLKTLLLPGRHVMTMDVDGRSRKFIFVTPSGFKVGESLPVVFFFHGAGGTAIQASRTYGWTEKADKEHFFAVFPEGLPSNPDKEGGFILNPHIWRDARGGNFPVNGINDVHFFEVLLGKLEATMPVDAHRIYLTGFSNGAGMSFTLGSHFSDRIAAIAPVSSQSFAQVEKLARPLPVYYLVGTADPLIPYLGGSVKLPWGNTRSMPPVEETVEQWVKLDGCPAEPQVVSDAGGVKVLRYGPGMDQSEVMFTVVDGNGHHWPGTIEPLPRVISGPALNPFNATDRVWEFFEGHSLP